MQSLSVTIVCWMVIAAFVLAMMFDAREILLALYERLAACLRDARRPRFAGPTPRKKADAQRFPRRAD